MTFAQGYDQIMGILIRVQVTILTCAFGATIWLVNQAFTTLSPERIEGLSELFKMSCATAIYASCGIIGTYLFRSAGFESCRNYRQWFRKQARHKRWLYNLAEWAEKTPNALLILAVILHIAATLAFPFALLRYSVEIFQWLQGTVV